MPGPTTNPGPTGIAGRGRSRGEQQRSLETRAALLTTARRLFGEVGYHATGTNEIVAQAKVTRGALYHHFDSKEALFEVVYREVASELGDQAEGATIGMEGQTLPRILATLDIYLALVSRRPDFQRILLIDGPAVFGWQRWRQLRADYSLEGWVRTLALLIEKGLIDAMPPEPMAHLILAALDDAALAIAHSGEPDRTRAEMTAALARLLGGLTLRAAG
ncbi:MAG TPA: TetR/AcrR family transcriptional regulator [Sphingobium sp.]